MAYESLSLSELIPATEEEIYSAWLSSDQHSAFTGDEASIDPVIGGKHSTFGGYAQGAIVDLQPGRRIVQTWRTTDFPEGSPDSRLELTLEATVGGTMITLLHTEIPGGQSDNYREGWIKYYFDPLRKYFGDKSGAISETIDEPATKREIGGSFVNGEPSKLTARAAKPATVKAGVAGADSPKAAPNAVAKAKPAAKARAKPITKAKVKTAAKVKPAAKAKAKPAVKAKAKAKAKIKAKSKAKKKPAVRAAAKKTVRAPARKSDRSVARRARKASPAAKKKKR